MKALIDAILKFFAKLFGKKDEAPAAEAPPVIVPVPDIKLPPTETVAPAPAEGLLDAAHRLGVPARLYAALILFAQYQPRGLSAEQLVVAFQAQQNEPTEQRGVEQDGRGTYPVSELSDNDAAYLAYMSDRYLHHKQNGDIYRDALAGSHMEINQAINRGDRINPGRVVWLADHDELILAVHALFV